MSENFNRIPNTTCDYCGKPIYKRPGVLNKQRYKTCGGECLTILRSEYSKGEYNHQYGLKGAKNATYKGNTYKMKNWYKHLRVPDHPYAIDGFVREHRLVAEKYLLDDINSIEIDGMRYLRPEYEVHHINGLRIDNRPENLMVLTKSEHCSLHGKLKKNKRDEFGRFKPIKK